MAASKHDPTGINEKLRRLTPEQAKALSEYFAHSNDGFFAAEKNNAKNAKSAKKSPAKKSGK